MADSVLETHAGPEIGVASTKAFTTQLVALTGATPIFVDVDEATFNMDVESLKRGILTAKRLELKPKAVIPVDLFGQSADHDAVAEVAKLGRAVIPAWVVPGSQLVKRQAEQEGLDKILIAANFEWREPGCSLCTAINGDQLQPGERCASTSNRNFKGRQGTGGRTHLVSPAMAAAAALKGQLTDLRELLRTA